MMYTFYLNLVFFICYSYFHIPCLFSFIVSVSFFDFSFFFHPFSSSLLFFVHYYFFKKRLDVVDEQKSIERRGTMGIAEQLPALSTAVRSIFNRIARQMATPVSLECIRHARDLYTYFKPRKMLRYDTRREVVY